MTLKTLYSKHHDRTVKMGRKRPKKMFTSLALPNYNLNVSPPPTYDFSPAAMASLTNIFENDSLGDCVIAAGYHYQGLLTGNSGQLFIPNSSQIIADYSAIGGYVPGKPDTDQGCDEATAMTYWTNHGFANGDKLIGAIQIDGSNQLLLKQAVWLFENVFYGVELPDAWVNPMPENNGFLWNVNGEADQNNGHAFLATGYNDQGTIIDTWGMFGTLTWNANAKYTNPDVNGNCYVLLSHELLIRGQDKAPDGLDWAALVADFDAIGGQVPVPPPSPAPVPPSGRIVIDLDYHVFSVPSDVHVQSQNAMQIIYKPGQHTLALNTNKWHPGSPSSQIIIDPSDQTIQLPSHFRVVHLPGSAIEIFPAKQLFTLPIPWTRK